MVQNNNISRQPSDIVREVREVELHPPLANLVQKYNEKIGLRDEYLWRWLSRCFQFVTLDCVPEKNLQRVCTHKTILSMFVTLVDDLAENLNDTETFQEATNIPFDHRTATLDRKGVDTEYLDFLCDVWETVETLIQRSNNASDLRSFLEFDLQQALNAMDYERLANTHPEIINRTEMLEHTPHNMMMLAAADIDLMYSPAVDCSDISSIRSTVSQGQQLVRISNWASTWGREIEEGDITSAVFFDANTKGVISDEELFELSDADSDIDRDVVRTAIERSGVEQEILADWDRRHEQLKENVPETDSVDLLAFVEGIQRVREYHMKSKGHK